MYNKELLNIKNIQDYILRIVLYYSYKKTGGSKMFQIFSILINTMAGVIVLVPILIIIQVLHKKQVNTFHKIGIFLYACFLSAIFAATGIPNVNDCTIDLSLNLIPFKDILNSPIQYILNVILFIPIGFILPLIWSGFSELKKVMFWGFGLSLFVEIIQIFTFRATDIDDLIMNTLGTIVGFVIAMSIKKIKRRDKKQEFDNTHIVNYELYFISALTFLIMFFVQPFIADFIWLRII